jgi:hypothetical protein
METIGNPISTKLRFGGVTHVIPQIETPQISISENNTKKYVILSFFAVIAILATSKYLKMQADNAAKRELANRKKVFLYYNTIQDDLLESNWL